MCVIVLFCCTVPENNIAVIKYYLVHTNYYVAVTNGDVTPRRFTGSLFPAYDCSNETLVYIEYVIGKFYIRYPAYP